MTQRDLLTRLRMSEGHGAFHKEAADEIERLRERNREHEERYDALEAKEEYHRRDAGRLRPVTARLLESYLASFNGNKDTLALEAEALLRSVEQVTPKADETQYCGQCGAEIPPGDYHACPGLPGENNF